MKTIIALFGLTCLFTTNAFAQQYSIDWHKVAGGGISTEANFSLLTGPGMCEKFCRQIRPIN